MYFILILIYYYLLIKYKKKLVIILMAHKILFMNKFKKYLIKLIVHFTLILVLKIIKICFNL
jgi:hypothetical protein